MKSTAKTGNPSEASRGAAVTRAKKNLGDAIDARLNLYVEALEMELLAKTIGVPVGEVRGRLESATLGELTQWTAKVLLPTEESSGIRFLCDPVVAMPNEGLFGKPVGTLFERAGDIPVLF